ncbi:MAG: MFS transporter [Pseudolabrys sp.]
MTLKPKNRTKYAHAIMAISIGNALEWYEIVVYGYFAPIIAHLFFPTDDPFASLMLAFAAFGITFIMRPLGAVFLGAYADRYGRKVALQISILMMMAASAAIACAPDYGTVGIAAPVVLVAARMVQGFAVGGEFGSSTAFLAEQDAKRRGFFASWQFASQGLTAILAAGMGTAITSLLSSAQIDSWGWRLPFLFGLLIGPVGYYIRRRVPETEEFRLSRTGRSPLRSIATQGKQRLLLAIGIVVLGTVAIYTMVFMPTYVTRQLGLSVSNAFATGMLNGVTQLLLVPVFGALSDRLGRTTVPLYAAFIFLLVAYPAFVWLAEEPSVAKLLLFQTLFGVMASAYIGALPALMAELFPVCIRTSGLAISYSLGVAIFGGFSPLLHAWLIHTQNFAAPSYLVVAAAAISLTSLFFIRRIGHR